MGYFKRDATECIIKSLSNSGLFGKWLAVTDPQPFKFKSHGSGGIAMP